MKSKILISVISLLIFYTASSYFAQEKNDKISIGTPVKDGFRVWFIELLSESGMDSSTIEELLNNYDSSAYDIAAFKEQVYSENIIDPYRIIGSGHKVIYLQSADFLTKMDEILNEIINADNAPLNVVYDALETNIRIHDLKSGFNSKHDYIISKIREEKVELPESFYEAAESGKIILELRKNYIGEVVSLDSIIKKSRPEAADILNIIYSAFENVTLEEGVSLHQTIVLDNYGSIAQQNEARKIDEKMDWKKLIAHPELKNTEGIGGPAFFDAKGFRFHLPAYMCLIICEASMYHDVSSSFILSLTRLGDSNSERFDLLDTDQKAAVACFLKYLLIYETDIFNYEIEKIENAIEYYFEK